MTQAPVRNVPFTLAGKGGDQKLVAVGSDRKVAGQAPAIVLCDPLYPRNVAGVLRACSAWGMKQLWWTGTRVQVALEKGERLPREERMKGYSDVELYQHDRPLDYFDKVPVICVELKAGAIAMQHFVHPDEAVYVFGPEDGSVYKGLRHCCHQFVYLPTHHCLNLAAAVNVVLAHRRFQRITMGLDEDLTQDQWLHEHRGPLYTMDEMG